MTEFVSFVLNISFTVCVVLQLLVAFAMFRTKAASKYSVLALYVVLSSAITLFEESARLFQPSLWRSVYWLDEAILQLLIFAVVISLIAKGLEDHRNREIVTRALIVGAVLICAISYAFHSGSISRWMTTASRNLSFCSAILNLLLWTLLAGRKHPDSQLLLVSGGLGLQTAGKAIGHSLRHLSRSTTSLGGALIVISYLLCMFIWWRAFSATATKNSTASLRERPVMTHDPQ